LFDHMVPPQPPTFVANPPVNVGASTVDISLERHNVVTATQQGTYTADTLPYGLGPRVPMFVVSPWSKGGFVSSQVFDHTSTLDFTKSDASFPSLPNTANYVATADLQCALPTSQAAPAATAAPSIAAQEPGTRLARATPYELHVNGQLGNAGYT
ncbi:alkaline phosphatase family protein, partial [Burkholderia ambifaria]|uniref:alkaline phosphatase family protein n=1 Tax=Burkholderia ambifaria TaxID=152480 RepID=UPI00244649F9